VNTLHKGDDDDTVCFLEVVQLNCFVNGPGLTRAASDSSVHTD
jgi:hypothetical protein